jgi:hypothetical protein
MLEWDAYVGQVYRAYSEALNSGSSAVLEGPASIGSGILDHRVASARLLSLFALRRKNLKIAASARRFVNKGNGCEK